MLKFRRNLIALNCFQTINFLTFFVLLFFPFSQISCGRGPIFMETFSEQISDSGAGISLKCVASGEPLPQVTWSLDRKPVPDNSRFRSGDYVTRESVVVSYVNISAVTPMDGGLYVSWCYLCHTRIAKGRKDCVTWAAEEIVSLQQKVHQMHSLKRHTRYLREEIE